MADHQDHEDHDPIAIEDKISPDDDPVHFDDLSPDNEDHLPSHHLEHSVDDMDYDIEYPDFTMEEQVEQEEDGLLIGTLYFTNGLSQDTTEIKLFAGREIIVGRGEEDASSCQFIIADFRVSKKHLRIYSIIYEQTELDKIQPLIYCEDLESTNGTFVNDECIGKAGRERRGHLLSDGDVVEIKPYWKYHFQQQHKTAESDGTGFEVKDLQYFMDQYNVTDRVLGSGQYGTVYLAQELMTSRQVACKIINLKDVEGDAMNASGSWAERCRAAKTARDKSLREVTILGKLSHPHILDLRKAFCSNKFIYMFTELAPAGDLFSYCDARGGKLSDVESRIICRQIALALEYMHKKDIAHRDIKKENVLIMQTYAFSCRVVLTDFGFANYLDPRSRRMLSKVGTDDYAAPEVEAIDLTSIGYGLEVDMYSLGKLTLNMLYGDTSHISRDVYSRQSQENVEMFKKALQIDGLTLRANKFLRGLLHRDAAKRLTISQALQHSWFKMPQREAAAIDDAFKRINRFWKPRLDFDTVIEDLPDRVALRQGMSVNSGTKPRRRIPEIHPYPFIGLDSRLNPRVLSSRGSVLRELKEKDSLFVTDSAEKVNMSAKVIPRKQVTKVKSVLGTNIFGTQVTKVKSVLGTNIFGTKSLASLAEGDGNEDSDEELSVGMGEYRLQGDAESSNQGSARFTYSDNPWSEQMESEPRSMARKQSLSLRPVLQEDENPLDGLARIPRNLSAKTYGAAVQRMLRKEA